MDTRYYQIGGVTIELNSEIPFKKDTFQPKFRQFEVHGPGQENIVINHYFYKTIHTEVTKEERIYFKKPWAVYEKDNKIIYEWIRNDSPDDTFLRKMITNQKHTFIDIYNDQSLAEAFNQGMLQNITLLPTDQILLCRIFGFHHGCLVHSIGLIHKSKGYLFIGHSGAGKTTMARIMEDKSTILCDDRNIVRSFKDGYRLYGTWRHSDLADVSPLSAPLKGIFFLNQSKHNQLELIKDNKQSFFLIMDHLVRSLVTREWMDATFDLVENLSKDVDCFNLKFDKSGKIKELIDEL